MNSSAIPGLLHLLSSLFFNMFEEHRTFPLWRQSTTESEWDPRSHYWSVCICIERSLVGIFTSTQQSLFIPSEFRIHFSRDISAGSDLSPFFPQASKAWGCWRSVLWAEHCAPAESHDGSAQAQPPVWLCQTSHYGSSCIWVCLKPFGRCSLNPCHWATLLFWIHKWSCPCWKPREKSLGLQHV